MSLMFNKAKVEEATHPLVRLLRYIFYKKKMTLDDFSTLYAQHGKRLGLASHMTNTNRNNARKALNHPENITFALFQNILYNILHEDVVNFSVTVRNQSTGELVTYSSTDPVD